MGAGLALSLWVGVIVFGRLLPVFGRRLLKDMESIAWLEQSAFAVWVRESTSLLAYPTFLTLHAIGMGVLVGLNAAVDLRVLGFAPRLPLAPLDELFPIMWFGFWVNALSGVVLLVADATNFLTKNPTFYVKVGLIALAVVNMRLLRSRLLTRRGKFFAGTSLALWTGAITAGRLTAYLSSR